MVVLILVHGCREPKRVTPPPLKTKQQQQKIRVEDNYKLMTVLDPIRELRSQGN